MLLPWFYVVIPKAAITDSRAGDILALFAAGIALLVLFVASYSGRGVWIACGSTALSLAVLAGFAALSSSKDPAQLQARAAWLAKELSPMLDRQTLDALTASIERIATASSRDSDQPPRASPAPAASQAMQAASTPGWFATKKEPERDAGSPVTWLLDEPAAQIPTSRENGFVVGGVNVSDQDLQDVRATLKTDTRQIELALRIGASGPENEPVIPAGARFSLIADMPEAEGGHLFAGGVLTFRYAIAGQQKAAILPLTGPAIAPSADRR